jgi:hypothetical protein
MIIFPHTLAGINIDHAREQFAAGELQNAPRSAAKPFRHFHVGAANLVEASVCSLRKRVARRIATGSNQAHSIKTFLVEKEISVSPHP